MPPKLQVTAPTPAIAERKDPIVHDVSSHQAADRAVDAAHRSVSTLVDPATQDRISKPGANCLRSLFQASSSSSPSSSLVFFFCNVEDRLTVHLGPVHDAYQKLNIYCAKHLTVFGRTINVLDSRLELKSFDNTFVEVSKVLVDGLDLLGELHPFVKGAFCSILSEPT